MTRLNIMVIRESIERVVQLLSRRKIKVTQRGAGARVAYNKDGSIAELNLPYIPDDASESFIAAVQGFLDHEVGHVLFSDPAVLMKAVAKGPRIASMANMIEDVFVERKMAAQFSGSGVNLAEVRKFYLDKMVTPNVEKALTEGDARTAAGYLMVVQARAWGGQTQCRDYLADLPVADDLLREFREAVDDLADMIPTCDSSEQCLQLAERIVNRIAEHERKKAEAARKEREAREEAARKKREAAEKSREKAKPESKPKDDPREEGDEPEASDDAGEPSDGEGDDPESDGASGEGEPDKDTPKGEKADKDTEPERDIPEDDPVDDADDDAGASEDDPVDEGDDDDAGDDEGESTDEGDEGDESRAGEGEPSTEGELSKMLDEERDFDKDISEALGTAAAEAIKSADYRVFSKEWDQVEPAPLCGNPTAVARMDEQTRTMVGVMTKQLERAMASQSRVGFNPGMRSGRINPSALFKAGVGDDRLFRHRYERHSRRTAVTLLIDCSGSMSGERIATAGLAAYGLSSALERLHIDNEVIGFTTRRYSVESRAMSEAMEAEARARGRISYGRSEPIYMPLFKGFDEKLNPQTKSRIAELTDGPRYLAENPDGECLQIAAHRLMSRRNVERRIMIVLSDGQPACPPGYGLREHLRKVVKELTTHMDVVGIGIQTESVRDYYPKAIVLNDLAELPGTVVGQLSQLLLAP